MTWFDPSDDVVIVPAIDARGVWQRTYGTPMRGVARNLFFANNGDGRLFERLCQRLDQQAMITHDHRERGLVEYRTPAGTALTVCVAPTPAPWAARQLEVMIACGTQRIVFLNGAGALDPEMPVGSVVLPRELVREEGTSLHYAPSEVVLRTNDLLRARLRAAAAEAAIAVVEGDHWTTDAIYRETRGKVARLRAASINTVDMELSALAGVAHFRGRELAAVHVVTDVLTEQHSWNGIATTAFDEGAEDVATIATACALAL